MRPNRISHPPSLSEIYSRQRVILNHPPECPSHGPLKREDIVVRLLDTHLDAVRHPLAKKQFGQHIHRVNTTDLRDSLKV